MSTDQQAEPNLGEKIKAAWDEGAREIGQRIRDQHQRAGTLILRGRSRNQIGEIISIGPHSEDDYIAEEIRHGYAHGHSLYRVVVGGKLLPESSDTRDFALMLYLAAENDSGNDTDGARWAARTLGIPNGYDS